MHIRGFIIVIFIGFSLTLTAQNQTNFWYFGENAGLDFSSGAPIPLFDGQIDTREGSASISDANGNLLFYTDGSTVYDRTHNVMQGGVGLEGDSSSTHSAIIVPKPNDPNIFFIFTVDDRVEGDGLQYNEVDMTLNGGLGGITALRNQLLLVEATEKLMAIQSSDGDSFWVITHRWESDEFLVYNVDENGVNETPIVIAIGNYIGGDTVNAVGAIKFSPDGTKLAVANSNENSVELFDFDTATGTISNPILLLDKPYDEVNVLYGIEFSPNSKVLYVTENNVALYQFNLQAGTTQDIIDSQFTIASGEEVFLGIQLAPDGKIYGAKFNQYLDVINNPNMLGTDANYESEAIDLSPRESLLGLPPFIQSFLRIDDITFENTCFGDSTQFTLADNAQGYDSINWNFDDPASGANNMSMAQNPTHIFTQPGIYEVTCEVTVNTQTAVLEATVEIFQNPTATAPQSILACDDDNDGFFSFNLTEKDVEVLNGQDAIVFQVDYYASMADYNADNAIANPSNYVNENAYQEQTIIASVTNINNRDCEATTTFSIDVFNTPIAPTNIPILSECDNESVGTDDDGRIQFDLTQRESQILNGQSSLDYDISYFRDSALNNEILNPESYENTNPTETIYVQLENIENPDCAVTTSFQLEVKPLPMSNAVVELRQCDDDLDGFSTFNLNEANIEIANTSLNYTITYFESDIQAENNDSPITNPDNYTNENVTSDTVWARVEEANGCHRTAEISLLVSTSQIPPNYEITIYECDDDSDGDIANGISRFDLTETRMEIESLYPPTQNIEVTFYESEQDALAEQNVILNIANHRNAENPNIQELFVRVDNTDNNDCVGLGQHITLIVETVPIANPIAIQEQCDVDGDGMASFDTSMIQAMLVGNQTGISVSYFNENGQQLSTPLPNPFVTNTQDILARVTNANSQDNDGPCTSETVIVFSVEDAVMANPVADQIQCDSDNNGSEAFDTSTIQSTVLGTQTGFNVIYTDENGNTLPSPLPNPFETASHTITARVENPNNPNCFDETSIHFEIVEQPILTLPSEVSICDGDSVVLEADSGYDSYLWSTGETTTSIEVDIIGLYEVMATNSFNDFECSETAQINVVASETPTIQNISIEDWTPNDNSIIINTTIIGDFEYSLDGINFQDSSVFTNLSPGDYSVFVRDKEGCGVDSREVYIMAAPQFFTPNNDGFNDHWQIFSSNKEQGLRIFIYDRYGKLIKQLSPTDRGWDGTYLGRHMPASDYWFGVERSDGRVYKGNFTLKR